MDYAKVNATLTKQSKREFAYLEMSDDLFFTRQQYCFTNVIVVGLSSNRTATNSLYRYPSPNRSAYSPSRPITVFRRKLHKMQGDIGYHSKIAMHQGADRTNCGATYKTTIGLRLCKRHQSSLRQWQYLVWQVALRATLSAAWQAQAQALSPQKCLALTALVQCLPVQQPVCCATTQALTAVSKTDNRAHIGRVLNRSRRRGYAPAAVLRFGDQR